MKTLTRILCAGAVCLLIARTASAQPSPPLDSCPTCPQGTAGVEPGEGRRLVRLKIYNQSRMTEAEIAAMVDLSRRIWLPYGVTLEKGTSADGLAVVISGGERHPARIESGAVLGDTIFTSGHATPYIRLWRRPAEAIAARTPGRVGQIMGIALAHELGHYLLDTDKHSSRGLLQAGISLRLLQEPDLACLELTPSQRRLVAAAR